jgi:hypothetical protein
MSVKTPYWIARAARVCLNAARLGRIASEGRYALLSCRDGESRHVRLFLTAGDRNRAAAAWERTGQCGLGAKCVFDHRFEKIDEKENETTEITTEKTTVHAAG